MIPSNSGQGRARRTASLLELREEFYKEYPTDLFHVLELCLLADGDSVDFADGAPKFICRYCASSNIAIADNCRSYICQSCRAKGSFTAGTFFTGIKKPESWNMAIFFLRKGIALNTKELELLAGISQSSAWTILNKISLVVFDRLMKFSNSISSIQFLDQITKRSITTPEGLSPGEEVLERIAKAEEISTQSGEAESTRPTAPVNDHSDEPEYGTTKELSDEFADELDDLIEARLSIRRLLGKEPVSFEDICISTGLPASQVSAVLSLLEMDQEVVSIVGNLFMEKNEVPLTNHTEKLEGNLSSTDLSKVQLALVHSIKEFLYLNYSGVSRKYLQAYLALFWLLTQKASQAESHILKAFRRLNPIDRDVVRSFDSPLMVKLPEVA